MESSQSSLHAEPSRKSSNLNYGYNSDLLEVLEVSKMLHKAHKEHHSSGSSHHQHHHHKLDRIVESKHKSSRHKHKNNDIPQSDDLSRVDTHYSSIISPTGESFDFSRNEENEESEGVETQTEGGSGYDGSSVYMLADEYEKFTLDSRAEYDLECEPEDNKLTRVYSNVSSIFSTKTDKKSTNATIESGHRFMRLKDNLRS